MEEPKGLNIEENPELRAQYLKDITSMLDGEKTTQSTDFLKVKNKIGGGLQFPQDLRNNIELQHTVLDEQKEKSHMPNKDSVSIDSSGEGFLGDLSFHTPSVSVETEPVSAVPINDKVNYDINTKINNALSMSYPEVSKAPPENPAYKKFVEKFKAVVSNATGATQKTLNAFLHFRVEDMPLDRILENLANIQDLIPNEYAGLVHIAEEGVVEESKYPPSEAEGIYMKDPGIYGKKSSDLEGEKSSWGEPNRTPVKPVAPNEYKVRAEAVVGQFSNTAEDILAPIGPTVEQKTEPVSVEKETNPEALIAQAQSFEGASDQKNLTNESIAKNVIETEPASEPIVEDVSQDPVEEFSATQHEEPIGPMTKEDSEKIENELRGHLTEARQNFATYEVDYKKKIWDGKGKYQKLMAGLGAPEKQRPSIDKEQVHIDAEKAYMEAKWNLKNFIAGRDVEEFEYKKVVSGEKTFHLIDVGLMDQAESEFRLLQRQIIEATPEKQKNRIMKGLEILARVPTYQKVILGSALTACALGIAGGGTMAAAFTMFGVKIVRSGVGVTAGVFAGKAFDGIKRKADKEDLSNRLYNYGEHAGGDREEFEEQEKKNAEFFEKQERIDKKDRLKKAAIMAVVGGSTGIGAGMIQDAYIPSGIKVAPIDIDQKPRASLMDKMVKKQSPFEPASGPKVDVVPGKIPEVPEASAPKITRTPTTGDFILEKIPKAVQVTEKLVETPAPVEYATPVKVELSSKGFIDTIDKLKDAASGKKLTPALGELLDQSPEKIAMDLGLYNPRQIAESAFGLKGEQLAIDAEGNISLVHNSGATEVLMDSKGTLKPYAGEMVDIDKSVTSLVPKDVESAGVEKTPEVKVDTLAKAEVVIPSPPEISAVTPEKVGDIPIVEGVGKIENILSQGIEVMQEGGKVKALVYNGIEMAVPTPDYQGAQDIVSGKLPLNNNFQFNSESGARIEYNKYFEKTLISMDQNLRNQMFDNRMTMQYKGGQINVFQKGEDMTILLNGEKIGTGKIINGEMELKYEKTLGSGLFGSNNDFGNAFDEAQKRIMKDKMFFMNKK